MTTRYSHTHFLYVQTGIATNEQLVNSLTSSFSLNKNLLKNISLKFQTNIVTKNDGTTFGYGYLWVEDVKLYYILIGKNEDGSDRVNIVNDSSWIPDPNIVKQKQDWVKYGIPPGMSWYDATEKEDYLDSLLEPPKIKVNLPPLFTIQPFTYTEEQMKKDPSKTKDNFVFYPATISPKEDIISTYRIFCPFVPKNLTEKDFRNIFEKFSTSHHKIHNTDSTGTKTSTYPTISIDKKKQTSTAIISFDPTTFDALFALLMTRKTNIPGIGTLYFDHFKELKKN
jgi:hypothetical protein